MFVDDLIIVFFSKASQKARSNINKNLHNFCAMFEQLVDFHKSSIQILNNIQGAMKRRIGKL